MTTGLNCGGLFDYTVGNLPKNDDKLGSRNQKIQRNSDSFI